MSITATTPAATALADRIEAAILDTTTAYSSGVTLDPAGAQVEFTRPGGEWIVTAATDGRWIVVEATWDTTGEDDDALTEGTTGEVLYRRIFTAEQEADAVAYAARLIG